MVPIVITRAAAQGAAFADACRARLGARASSHLAPLLAIDWVRPCGLPGPEDIRILTSANGVAGLTRAGGTAGPAWCVGARTAAEAAKAGHGVLGWRPTAEDLVATLRDMPPGAAYHARGRESRGAVARRLAEAGWRMREGIVYDQRTLELPDWALSMMARPGLVPVFSPRTARRLAAATARIAPAATAVCLSPAVHAALSPPWRRGARIAARPDAHAMLDAMAAEISALERLEGPEGAD